MAKLIFSLSPSETLDFPLKVNLTRMGRDPANDIVINNSWISAFHAEFRRSGGFLTVYDLDSSNGTSVNGQRIKECRLKPGDIVAFGQLQAVYEALVTAQAVDGSTGPNHKTAQLPPWNLSARPASPQNSIRPQPSPEAPPAALPPPAPPGAEKSVNVVKPLAPPDAALVKAVVKADLPGLQQHGPEALLPAAGSVTAPATQKASTEQTLSGIRPELLGLETSLASARTELAQLQAAIREAQQHSLQSQEAASAAKSQLEDIQLERDRAIEQREVLTLALAGLREEDRISRESITVETAQAHEALTALKAMVAGLVSETEATKAEAARLHAESASLTSQKEQAAADLSALQGEIRTAKETTEAGDRKISVRMKALQQLEAQHNMLSAKIAAWEIQDAAAQQQSAAYAASHSTLQEQIRSMEARLVILTKETEGAEALSSLVSDLRRQQAKSERRLEILTDRLAGIAEAPDPNWGTVHALARSFIKHLDLVDDLIEHITDQGGGGETLEQLQIFQSGMIDTLKEYSVEPFTLEPGTLVDIPARKRISIVESIGEGGHDGTHVVRTFRPGYLCLNGDHGVPTLLRKAEVAVSLAVTPPKAELAPH